MFINFEGIDGCGKTSFAKRFAHQLYEEKIPYLHTREPTSRFRNLILSKSLNFNDDETLLGVFFDRLLHLKEEIEPALDQGYVVVNERFTPSSLAYQVKGGTGSQSLFDELDNVLENRVKPDIHIILDAPVDVAMERVKLDRDGKARTEEDRIEESNTHQFLEKVRQSFLQLHYGSGENTLLIDTSRDFDDMLATAATQAKLCARTPSYFLDQRTDPTLPLKDRWINNAKRKISEFF